MNRIGATGHGACAVFGAFNHDDIDLVVVPKPIPPGIAWRGHKVFIGAGGVTLAAILEVGMNTGAWHPIMPGLSGDEHYADGRGSIPGNT